MAYRGRSVGRLKNFLDAVFSSEDLVFDGKNKKILKNGVEIISYSWKENTDIPKFTFLKEEMKNIEERLENETERSLEKFGWVILDPEDEFEGTTGKYKIFSTGWLN